MITIALAAVCRSEVAMYSGGHVLDAEGRQQLMVEKGNCRTRIDQGVLEKRDTNGRWGNEVDADPDIVSRIGIDVVEDQRMRHAIRVRGWPRSPGTCTIKASRISSRVR